MPALYRCSQLAASDLPAMRALLRVFGEAFEDPESYASRQPDDAYLARLLAKDHVIAIAAFEGDGVIGGLVAYILDKFEQDRREVYIYDLAVLETHRRRKVATSLIAELRRIAALRDCYVIFVQADLEDAPAIALYQSVGVQETAHHFDIAVADPAPRAEP